jgi:hypothetical protein
MFTGTVPSELGKLSHLWFLKLEVNGLTGGVPIEVCDLVQTGPGRLQTLTVDCNEVVCTCCESC